MTESVERGRVVVGVDGSAGAQRALQWVSAVGRPLCSEVVAVHVLTFSAEFARDLSLWTLTSWRQRLHADLEGPWTQCLRESDVPHRCLLVEHDSVADGLLEAATTETASLIALGAHGRSALAGRLLGAVTYVVSHRATLPVVIVPVDWSTPVRHEQLTAS